MPRLMKDWRTRLAWELRAAKRLFVLGVGNPDRADDGAGILVARRLSRLLGRHPGRRSIEEPAIRRPLEAIQALDGGEVPESATGTIRKFQPTHILVIDAAAGGHGPGTVFFIDKRKIADDGVSTHRIPLSQLVRYLELSVGCRVVLVGIEPADTSPGKPMSPTVRKCCEILALAIEGVLLEKPDRPARRRPRSGTS